MSDHSKTTAAPTPHVRRKRGRPASKGEHAISESRVLEVAFATFAELGYEGTTLRALAKTLGVSHNLLHVRFGTKADLWRRAFDARVALRSPPVYEALEAEGLNDEERLGNFVRELCRWAARNPDIVALMNAEGRRITWRNEHIVVDYLGPVKVRLEALLEQVSRRRKVVPISTIALLSLMVNGAGSYFASGPTLDILGSADELSPANFETQVDTISRLILGGLLSSPA